MIVQTHHYTFDIIFAEQASEYWVTLPPGVSSEDSGYTDFDHERIVVRDDLSPAMKADTVLHELMHVAVEAGGAADKASMKEEGWVCHMTAGLKQMLVLAPTTRYSSTLGGTCDPSADNRGDGLCSSWERFGRRGARARARVQSRGARRQDEGADGRP